MSMLKSHPSKMEIKSMLKAHPTNKEIKLNPKEMLVSKTDQRGVITYGNKKFVEVSGYKENELIGSPHSILRHPDMPKAIFYLMWESIKKGQNIMAVVKNLARNGDHYWVTTDFDIQRDREGKIRNYIAYRQAAPKSVLKEIEPLYQKMLEIEIEHGMDASLKYLEGFLEEKDMSYNQYIENLAKPKGITGALFEKMKMMFA
jgi:PAS domain S-box-containing protein